MKPVDITSIVKDYAGELGFDLVAITSAEPFAEDQEITLERMRQGLMDGLPWYNESRVRRGCNPEVLLPGAKSIIALGISYNPRAESSEDLVLGPRGKVARYAWGDDYHQVLKRRMRSLVEGLPAKIGAAVRGRWYVDDGPMLDRAAGQRAGMGWFGKNTNILTSSHGSWVFLGQVITDLELQPDAPLRKTCGECRRCIDACPTGAIIAPYVLDNTLCISYLTIENKGPIPRHLRPLMLDWVFGCDICQDVCPVNVKAMYTEEQAFQKRRFEVLDLVALLQMTDDEFSRLFANSPIKRARKNGLQRNACVALGNACDPISVPALAEALRYGEPLVRGHAAWALGKIGGNEAITVLSEALMAESDEYVTGEVRLAIGDCVADTGAETI